MKKIIYITILLIIFLCPVYASTKTYDRSKYDNYAVNKKWKITDNNIDDVNNTPLVNAKEKIYDFADVLSDSEEETLYNKITEFINTYNMDMVIVTIDMTYSYDSDNENFAANFYDYNDFGIDYDKYDGILLLRNAYEEDPYYDMYTFGNAQLYFDNDRYDSVLDAIYYDLHSENYLDGFSLFIDKCSYYVNNGTASSYKYYYVNDNGYLTEKFHVPFLVVGIIAGIITIIFDVVFINKNKMVRKAFEANTYLDRNSINMTRSENVFVNKIVTHHRISSDTGGGGFSGGGGSHSGSSGGGHSSGGGRHG